jgi:hypothetical protein
LDLDVDDIAFYPDCEIEELLLPEHASTKQIRQAGGRTFAGGLKPAPTWNQVVGPGFSPDGSDRRQDASIMVYVHVEV